MSGLVVINLFTKAGAKYEPIAKAQLKKMTKLWQQEVSATLLFWSGRFPKKLFVLGSAGGTERPSFPFGLSSLLIAQLSQISNQQ